MIMYRMKNPERLLGCERVDDAQTRRRGCMWSGREKINKSDSLYLSA